jgi:hypothetical protein
MIIVCEIIYESTDPHETAHGKPEASQRAVQASTTPRDTLSLDTYQSQSYALTRLVAFVQRYRLATSWTI